MNVELVYGITVIIDPQGSYIRYPLIRKFNVLFLIFRLFIREVIIDLQVYPIVAHLYG
jgi:hypothetical protein